MPKMTNEEIDGRVNYHPPSPKAIDLHGHVRIAVRDALHHFNDSLPECREASLAITKLEEAMFWANAAIARNHDKI